MSEFGGIDRGVPGDAPYIGKTVIWRRNQATFLPAIVTDIREDGWTVSLQPLGTPEPEGPSHFVPYGGSSVFGEIRVGGWVTSEEYEGWKIWAAERADKPREETDGENEAEPEPGAI